MMPAQLARSLIGVPRRRTLEGLPIEGFRRGGDRIGRLHHAAAVTPGGLALFHLADDAALQHGERLGVDLHAALLQADLNDPAGAARGFDDLPAFGRGVRERLFDVDVAARFASFDGHAGMPMYRCCDQDDVDVLAVQQAAVVAERGGRRGVALMEESLRGIEAGTVDVAKRRDVDGEFEQGGQERVAAASSGADDTGAESFIGVEDAGEGRGGEGESGAAREGHGVSSNTPIITGGADAPPVWIRHIIHTMNIRWCWRWVLALAALDGLALDPGLRVSQFQKRYWGSEQGLPHSYVTAFTQDRDGYLWVGTDEGLVRFDGTNFREPGLARAHGLNRAWISALRRARDGSLWIGTFEGALLCQSPSGEVRTYRAGGSVFALTEDVEGRIWASSRAGVFRVAGDKLERAEGLQPPSENSWDVLASDAQGSVWVVDARGLFRYRDGRAEMVASNGGVHGQILSVAVGRSGAMRVGTSRGLFRLEGLSGLVRAGMVRGSVTSLLEDRDRRWWAGTWGQGVFRLGEGEERWTSREGLPDDFVRSLAEDGEGNLWIGMRGGGMGRWKNPRLVPYGAPEGLAGNYATTVAMDRADQLWLGTWRGGLYRLRGERFEAQPAPVPVPDFTVRALAFDREGRPWIGNWEGLFQLDGDRYRRYGTEAGSPFGRVSALLFDRAGALWVGTADRGLFVFREGRPGGEVPAPYLAGLGVTALFEDSGGRVWAGTSRGMGAFEPGGKRLEWQAELGTESVESLMEDSKQRLWATTASGSLVVLSRGGMKVLDARHGLPSHPMYRVLEDGAGSFWISTPRGILELEREALEEVLAGKRSRLSLLSYGVDDGMRTIECHGLSQPAGGRAADGTLWFPTSRGFVKVRRASGQSLARPLAQIDDVRISGSRVAHEGRLRLEAGARNIELQYSAVRLTNPGKIRFRYRMEGFDPAWVEAGGVRSARYNQLPPGPYRFQVQARDPAGEWGNVASLEVEQSPRFYQTWWFVLLCGLSAGGLIVGLYRWRLRGVRSAYALVNEERNRIGREWHDTLVAGFSAISLQLEAAIAKSGDEPARSAEILQVTKKMVHHYRAEARRVIWDLRDSRPEGETLPAALRNALRRATETRGIEAILKVTGTEAELPLEMQHNILRIGQEAMSNAARHAAASRITLRLSYTPETIQLTVADNGRGFDYESALGEATGHFGLVVMDERVKRLGGKLKVSSEAGTGSTVEAVIPVPKRERK